MSKVIHYMSHQSIYNTACGKNITSEDRRTPLVEKVTCKTCIATLNSNRIARQKAREEKRKAMIVMRKTTDQIRLQQFIETNKPKQVHLTEEDRMMADYVSFDPNADRSVEATCMNCGKKYINKYGNKHGLCESERCSKEEDISTDPVTFGT